jgi:peptidyl-prolyl cis-trans isomerase D
MLRDLFSDDVLKNHHNTEVVEVSPNTMVAARLLTYQPASQQSLAQVSSQIVDLLKKQQARAQVAQQGEAMLTQLRAGKEPAGLRWSNFTLISRTNPGAVASTHLLTQVFSADDQRLPAYVGAPDPQGNFQLVRVTRVLPVSASDAGKFQALGGQVARMQADQAFKDYIDVLVAKAKIQVNQSVLSKAVQ